MITPPSRCQFVARQIRGFPFITPRGRLTPRYSEGGDRGDRQDARRARKK